MQFWINLLYLCLKKCSILFKKEENPQNNLNHVYLHNLLIKIYLLKILLLLLLLLQLILILLLFLLPILLTPFNNNNNSNFSKMWMLLLPPPPLLFLILPHHLLLLLNFSNNSLNLSTLNHLLLFLFLHHLQLHHRISLINCGYLLYRCNTSSNFNNPLHIYNILLFLSSHNLSKPLHNHRFNKRNLKLVLLLLSLHHFTRKMIGIVLFQLINNNPEKAEHFWFCHLNLLLDTAITIAISLLIASHQNISIKSH